MAKYKLNEEQIDLIREQAQLSILDENNPTSLVSLAPPCLAAMIKYIGTNHADWLVIPEWALRGRCKADERDERTRLALWDEYSQATSMKRKIRLNAILNFALTKEMWERIYLQDWKKIVYIITPPRSYDSAMKQIVNTGLKRMLEIINLPIVDDKGKVNTQVVTQILKTFHLADQRLRGSIVQNVNIQQKSLNLNANVPHDMVTAEDLLSLDPDELDALESKVDKAARKRAEELAALPRPNDFDDPLVKHDLLDKKLPGPTEPEFLDATYEIKDA